MPGMPKTPKILVFDSGLGGLTVLAGVMRLRPDAACLYVADDAVFPYGRLAEIVLVARVDAVLDPLIARHRPDIVVIACHTASTLVLPGLRARWPYLPFVGTVPAIKPGAQASRSGMVSVLATPGTVARDYTQNLIREFASHCAVKLVGAIGLAGLAEDFMRDGAVNEAAILAEIAPAFVDAGGRRTDVVVLACTHYPLLLPLLERLAPWPVQWVDPAPAIARRADQVLRGLLGEPGQVAAVLPFPALLTSGRRPGAALKEALRQRGLFVPDWAPMPSTPEPSCP